MNDGSTRVFILYNAILGPVMRTTSKQVKKQYLNQYIEKPETDYEYFIEVDLDDLSKQERDEVKSIPEPYYVGEYVITESQYEMYDNDISQFYTELDDFMRRFLSSLQYLKLSQTETESIFNLLDLFRPIMEIRLDDEHTVDNDIDDFIDLTPLVAKLYKFKKVWDL